MTSVYPPRASVVCQRFESQAKRVFIERSALKALKFPIIKHDLKAFDLSSIKKKIPLACVGVGDNVFS